MNNSKLIYGIGLIAIAVAVFFLATRVKGKFHFGGNTHWGSARVKGIDSFSISGVRILHSQGTANIIIIPSDDERAVFYYNKEEIENLSELKDSTLYIDFKGDGPGIFQFRKSSQLRVKLYTRSLNNIKQEGVGSMHSKGTMIQENVILSNEGVGSMEFDLQCKKIDISNGGVGSIDVKGTTETLTLKNEGTGSIDAESLMAKSVRASNQGIGSISLNASESMDMANQGVGSIEYSGEGKVIRKVSQGIGSISKK